VATARGGFVRSILCVRVDPARATRCVGSGFLSLLGMGGVVLSRYTLGRAFLVRAKATELVTKSIRAFAIPVYVSSAVFILGL
jgi:hypothetical protein